MTASRGVTRIAVALTGLLTAVAAAIPAPAGEAAQPMSTGAVLSASGRVEPVSEERRVRFAVPGNIASLSVEQGKIVRAGQVLAELENGIEKAELARADASLASAKAALALVESGARAEERAVADAEVALAACELERVKKAARDEEKALAEARVEFRAAETAAAQRVAERVRSLGRAASQEELDAAEDRLAVAKAAENEARRNLALVSAPTRDEDVRISAAQLALAEARAALVKAPAREEDVANARAEVAAAEARRAAAQAALDRTILRSPVEGTVLKVFLRSGEAASPAGETPVATIGDVSRLMVRAEVDEVDVARVRVGQLIRAEARGLGAKRFTGKVVGISPTMGRKRLVSDDPREKIDTKVIEVMIELDGQPDIPVGYRLETYFFNEGGR